MVKIIKSFLYHCYWFNRKSQHYILGDWTCYITFYDIERYKEKINYYKRYPIAFIKFMWFSRKDIFSGITHIG